MKNIYYLILVTMGIIVMSSCSQVEHLPTFEAHNQSLISSRAVLESDSIIPFVPDSNLVIGEALTRAFSPREYDKDFHSNMWQIRELPLTIRARDKANTNSTYLSIWRTILYQQNIRHT